jgi:hypothetical protein
MIGWNKEGKIQECGSLLQGKCTELVKIKTNGPCVMCYFPTEETISYP